MKMTTSVPLGKHAITIEAEGLKSLFMVSGFFAKIPQRCGNCNSDNLVLAGYKNSGYDFFQVLCLDCKHELKFGQKKEDNSLFLRDDTAWEPPYSGGGGGGQQQPRQQQQPQQQYQQPAPQHPAPQDQGGDDIPF